MKQSLYLIPLLAIIAFGCASVPVTNGIPNFGIVTNGVYRGGQPNDEGFAYLKSIGVSNIVKLNFESEGSDRKATELGMRIIYLPIDTTEQLAGNIKVSTISKAVAIMLSKGTYVHCQHGQDRTGLVVAVYRVWINDWPKAQAREEMLRYGFHPILHGLNDFWEDRVK